MIIRVMRIIVRLGYFLIALGLVVGLAIIFGKSLLAEKLPGSDNIGFIAYAKWFYDWFPRIPFWYPQQGAGVSYSSYYPLGAHILLVLLAKLSGLNLVLAFRVMALSSVVVTSLGIYWLAWRLTKNQTVSLIGAVVYPLLPIAWIWLIEWGFTAESMSYMLIGPTLVWLDIYWSQKQAGWKQRLALIVAVTLAVLLLLIHPFSLASVVLLILLWAGLRRLEGKSFQWLVLVVGLSLFWVVPFFRYGRTVAIKFGGGDKQIDRQQFLQNAINWKNFFDFSKDSVIYENINQPVQAKSNYNWRDIAFPLPVSLLALAGLIGAFWLNKNLFYLGMANAGLLTLALWPELALIFRPLSRNLVEWRVLVIPSRIIIPILAGYGAYSAAYLISWPIKRWKLGFNFLAMGFSLAIAAGLIYGFKNWPNYPSYQISYGALREDFSTGGRLDLRNIWQQEFDVCAGLGKALIGEAEPLCLNKTLVEKFWPDKLLVACKAAGKNNKLTICQSNSDAGVDLALAACKQQPVIAEYREICPARVEPVLSQLTNPADWGELGVFKPGAKELLWEDKPAAVMIDDDQKTRMDTAGMGGLLMASQFYTKKPQLSVYHNLSSLISSLWNYQMVVFYDPKTVWSQPEIVDELAKYFSLEEVILPKINAPLERYRPESWEQINGFSEAETTILLRFKKPETLLTVTTRPLVLVVGQEKVNAYFRIFHLANLGIMPFDEAILVKGKENIDEYTAKELSQFDLVILEGYQYKKLANREKTWKQLDQYVRGGGNLMINTGWQYTSADWQLNKTPEFIPLKQLEWTEAGKTVDQAVKFSALDYHGNNWGVSSAKPEYLREWAEVVLSGKGMPLVARGNLGQGRVVWSGLDLVGHISEFKDNPAEIQFFKEQIDYLLAGKEKQNLAAQWQRDYPDKVEMTINEPADAKVGIYWSEAFHPDFKAKLYEPGKKQGRKLAVYKAGPGMSLFILPQVKAGSRIVWEYKKPLIGWLSLGVSTGTLILLIINIFKPIKFRIKFKLSKLWQKQGKNEEENY